MEKKTETMIVKYLDDISRSLRILSGREDNVRTIEKTKNTYKDKYFTKSE